MTDTKPIKITPANDCSSHIDGYTHSDSGIGVTF